MPKGIRIEVICTEEDDVDWVRNRVVPPVEDEIEFLNDEGRLDGKVEMTWEFID